jgi:hypothetical protein
VSATNDLAAEHSAAATDERARDRAGAWVPDEVPPQLKPFCRVCQRSTKPHVCGPCRRAKKFTEESQ